MQTEERSSSAHTGLMHSDDSFDGLFTSRETSYASMRASSKGLRHAASSVPGAGAWLSQRP